MIAVCLIATMGVHAAAEPSNRAAESSRQSPDSEKPSTEDLALVKGLILTGALNQAIGTFTGYSRLDVGATFELDLSNLPKDKIEFTRPSSNPEERPGSGGYIPLLAPIEITKVKKSEEGHVSIDLSAKDPRQQVLIQIVSDLPTVKSSSAYVTFYGESAGGLIGNRSLADARGELKVGDSVGADVNPKAGEPDPQNGRNDVPPFKPGYKNVEPPVGSLGYNIGSYLTIEGVRQEVGKVGNQTLRVDTINGHKLEQPVPIWMNGVELPAKERCIFKGYETGEWIGVPEEVLRATGKPAPQAGWQFRFSFAATSVEQPKGLKIE